MLILAYCCSVIVSLKRAKRRAERKWRKDRSSYLWKAYRNAKYSYIKELKKCKKSAVSDQINRCGNNPKKLYKLMDKLLCRSSINPMPESESDKILCEDFSDHFLGKINKIRDALGSNPTFCLEEHSSKHRLDKFASFSEEEVAKITAKVKTKTCELDPLPASLLSGCKDELIPIYTATINKSINESKFAKNWKTSIVRPLLKKPNLDAELKNYRPVANLSHTSKIVEKAVLSRLQEYNETADFIPSFQSAYREHHSCETALLYIHNEAMWAMEKQRVMPLVAIDLSAAFDTVDHGILLNVLNKRCGISESALSWFESYLASREMKVSVGSEYSVPKDLTFSVPQGSVLGPQLFSIYASTLGDIVSCRECKLNGFADDHTLHNSFLAGDIEEERKCVNDIEETLLDIDAWMKSNRLKMNSSKTEYIVFGTNYQKTKIEHQSISVLQDEIEPTPTLRLLGVHLDDNFSLTKHISHVCKICFLNIRKIRSIRKYIDINSCRTLVKGLVISHLDYCNSLFMGLPENEISRLQRVQNAAARLIFNLKKHDSISDAFKSLHWLRMRERIFLNVMSHVFNISKGDAPKYLQEMFHRKSNPRSLRSNHDDLLFLVPPTKRHTFADRSLSVFGPRHWNTLPYNIRSSATVQIFKNKLKTFLFDKHL